jgi:hypothetical protein
VSARMTAKEEFFGGAGEGWGRILESKASWKTET